MAELAASRSRQETMTALLWAAFKGPSDVASSALDGLRPQSEEVFQHDIQTADWLLDKGVILLSDALKRPIFGGAADADAAHHVAALCRVLLAAARGRSTTSNPGLLLHALTWLQFGAPACLRLLNLWLGDPKLTAGREDECLALAITAAELADAASCSEGLPDGQAPLLRFCEGCWQRVQAMRQAPVPKPAASTPSGSEHSTAASDLPSATTRGMTTLRLMADSMAQVGRQPEPLEDGRPDGWDAALGLAATAVARALTHESSEVREAIEADLRPVDSALSEQQEAAVGAQDAAARPPTRRQGRRKQKAATAVPDRTADGAEAAMRALLLEEEEAAAAAQHKAAPTKPKSKQAAKAAAAAAKAQSTAAATTRALAAAVGAGSAATAGPAAAAGTAAAPGTAGEAGAMAGGDAAVHAALPADQQWMLCPITQEVMRDPVLCEADGQTYERAAIAAWLQQHGTCFVSKAPAQTLNLLPNHMLRSIIQASQQ